MTQKQKENFEHWLTNNLQVTSKSNVELIIKHVEHYFCPTPPQSIGEAAKDNPCNCSYSSMFSTGEHDVSCPKYNQ